MGGREKPRRMALAVPCAVLVVAVVASACTPSERAEVPTGDVVETASGPLKGSQERGVLGFRGVPYAAPPVGDRRFMPPVDPDRWTDARPATKVTPACVQPEYYDPTDQGRDVQSEDCLTLNVWTPRADDRRRPVMVWIHGGAFVGGGCRNPWYDGSALARRGDVVVVCVQYRLGIFGFSELSHVDQSFAGGGNAGMLDQVAALTWVQRNISGFGGNPGNVTLFGESAGGEAIHLLMGMPQAKGLFHKAIIQSGILTGAAMPKEDSASQTTTLMRKAGVTTAQALQQVPAQRLQSLGDEAGVFQWPHLDGAAFTTSADPVIEAGDGTHVPLLIGTNLDEIRYWTAVCAEPKEPLLEAPTMVQNVFGSDDEMKDYFGPKADDVVATYRRSYPDPYDAVVTFLGDGNFRIASIRLAEVQSRFAPTYMYQFTYRSPVTGRNGRPYGASHSMELPFVFGTTPSLAEGVTGPSSRWGDLQERTMDAWLAFARTGNPATSELDWPAYDSSRRATMILGPTSTVADDPHADERLAWSETSAHLLPYPIPFPV